jgi:rod shape-determining protein MreD
LSNKSQISGYLVFIFLTVIVLVIQGSFLSFYFTRGKTPDLLLIVVVCLAFLWGEKRGIVIGIIAGFLQDIFYGPALGFFVLAKMLAAYLAGLTSSEVYKDQIIGPMITVFMATFVHEFIVYFLLTFFWEPGTGFIYALAALFLPRAIYHFVLTLFFYPLLYRAEQKGVFYFFLK